MGLVNASQSYKQAMKTVDDLPFIERLSEDDPRLLNAHAAVLAAFDPCEPLGSTYKSGESLAFSLANDGVARVSPASILWALVG